MITTNLSGSEIYIFPTDGLVSHISWMGPEKVFAYCNTKQYGEGYYIFIDKKLEFKKIDFKFFTSDGHPQYNEINKKNNNRHISK